MPALTVFRPTRHRTAMAQAPARPAVAAARFLRVVIAADARWRSRCALASLPDRMLRDIGLTQAQVRDECSKPGWRR